MLCAVALMKVISTICLDYDFDRGLNDRVSREWYQWRKKIMAPEEVRWLSFPRVLILAASGLEYSQKSQSFMSH